MGGPQQGQAQVLPRLQELQVRSADQGGEMTTTIIDKALRRVADDVAALIEEHADAIRSAISNQMLITAEEDDEAKLVFSLGIASKITPQGTEANVSTTIAWAVKEKKTMSTNVSDQPELPLEQ